MGAACTGCDGHTGSEDGVKENFAFKQCCYAYQMQLRSGLDMSSLYPFTFASRAQTDAEYMLFPSDLKDINKNKRNNNNKV